MKRYFILFLVILLLYVVYILYNEYYESISPIDLCSKMYDREKIYEFDNLLTRDECNQIIEMAKPNLAKSTVMSKEVIHPGRTSSHVFLSTTNDLLRKIDNIVYSYLKIPIENYETLQVVNYKPTQKYDAHYDTCDPNDKICIDDTKRMGSLRYATFIIYLNDNFTGGETEFPKKNIKTIPKIGRGVLFFNLNDNNTNRRLNSFHAGLPPTTGEKWMSNKWIRLKKITDNI